ncbi:MAG TPA: cysteine hydrolase [Acidimicrobiia bacterium]|nr:cysteine hydrolase [Acidimicrobiia bacterium]
MAERRLHLEPDTTALVLIECQGGVVGAQSMLPELAAAAGPALEVISILAARAREVGVLVVHLTYVPIAGNRSSNRKPPLFAAINHNMDTWAPNEPETTVVPEIGVGPNDLVLERHQGLSPTYGTETYKILRNLGMTTLLVGGVSTNVAIPTASAEAVDEGFSVVIARDATVGTPAEHHESMLRHTLPFIATMTSSEKVLHEWAEHAG